LPEGYGSKTNAHATFKDMLEAGNPPDRFDALMKEAVATSARFEDGPESASDRQELI
jgi:toxin YhaV